ncbi:uncharacterized protein LOC120683437 [Panicum virgatum]|uniref:Uncharacterized protein n=1 Tax=Panicum virgatum TaxID=38727 RepID=A0A8T0Q203_PANVG|nr:uncharacterized protein LOC120683437 [Panicum virgatum]KAG2566669.1 hypothetical protein PVAP13_7NG177900 [Panicum virgatum]
MGVLSLAALAVLVLAALLSSGPTEVRGVPVPAAAPAAGRTGDGDRGALPPEQRRPRRSGGRTAAAASGARARLDASSGEAAAGGGSPASAVFDPDRMSKRRVRRGSDPIHNKC